MNRPADPSWLDADRADFMQGSVAISLGACDSALRPSVTKGLGCQVRAGGEVRVFVDASVSEALVRDVAETGRVAVVFSEIHSHRTLQVKARDVRLQPLAEDEHALVEAHARGFGGAIMRQGYPDSLVRGFLASRPEDRLALVFHPDEAFEQTPGPQAGQRLGSVP